MGNGGTSLQHPGTFEAIQELDGEVGPADRVTKPRKARKTADIYIERKGQTAEPFVYMFVSEGASVWRATEQVSSEPDRRRIQTLKSLETKAYNLEQARRLILSLLVLVNSWRLLGK